MTTTIYDLPPDCINEIYSYIPKRCYPDLLCVSNQFSKTIDLLSATEAKVYNAFLLFLKIPTLPSSISFQATHLFDLKQQIEKLEINLAKLLSTLEIKILEDSCRNQSFYPDIAWVFCLAYLFKWENLVSTDILQFLLKNGQFATFAELSVESFQLPESHFLQFKNIIMQLNRVDKNIFIDNVWGLHIFGKGQKEITACMHDAEEIISMYSLMKKGKVEDSLKLQDDSLLFRNPLRRFIDLCDLGTFSAKEGNWEGIRKVLIRIDSLADTLKPESIRLNIRKKIITFYQSINFEKIPEKIWESILEEPPFEPFIFERLITLDDENKIIKYFKKCSNNLARDLLLQHGKFSLARRLNVEEAEIIIAELKSGAITHADYLERILLQNNNENGSLIRKLAVAYAAQEKFEKALSLAEAIDPTAKNNNVPPFRQCLASEESFFLTFFERERALMEISILLAIKNRFQEANDLISKIQGYHVKKYALGKVANYAAATANYEYLAICHLSSDDIITNDQLFEFATRDSFDPKTFLQSTLSNQQKLITLKCGLIYFLINKNKLEKAIDLFNFAKSLPLEYFSFEFGMACAEKGYSNLALDAAELFNSCFWHFKYQILFTLKLNK